MEEWLKRVTDLKLSIVQEYLKDAAKKTVNTGDEEKPTGKNRINAEGWKAITKDALSIFSRQIDTKWKDESLE